MNVVQWVQLRGMMLYEFKMHWRRRTLLVVILAVLVVIALISLIGGSDLSKLANPEHIPAGSMQQVITAMITFVTWSPLSITLAIVLPIITADTIPLDRQNHVNELLDTLPLPSSVYLTGKLLGVWAAALLSLVIGALVTAVIWWVRVGNYDLRIYLEMWIVGAAALVVINGGLGVILAAGQTTRRRAIVVVVVLLFVLAAVSGSWEQGSLLLYTNPVRPVLLTYYMYSAWSTSEITSTFVVTSQDVLVSIGIGIVQLAVFGLLAWGWLRWRESRT